MSDGAVIHVPSGREFGDKSIEELEKMLDNMTPDGDIATEEPSEPVAPPDPEPLPVVPTVEAEPEPEPEVKPELDLADLEREGDRISREKLEAQLSLMMAHNSRLAGKLGFLEQKLNSVPAPSEPYEPQSSQDMDRLTLVEQRLASVEARRVQSEVSQAVAESIGRLDGPWVQELAKEIASVAPKYADQMKAAQDSNDPELARQIATAVATVVKAEATQMKWQERHDSVISQRTAATADMAKAKKAQTPSGSGGVPSPPPQPKTTADMTAAEADAWLKENVR